MSRPMTRAYRAQRIAELTAELERLEPQRDGAYAAYLLAQDRETDDRAWAAFVSLEDAAHALRCERDDLIRAECDDDAAADVAAYYAGSAGSLRGRVSL